MTPVNWKALTATAAIVIGIAALLTLLAVWPILTLAAIGAATLAVTAVTLIYGIYQAADTRYPRPEPDHDAVNRLAVTSNEPYDQDTGEPRCVCGHLYTDHVAEDGYMCDHPTPTGICNCGGYTETP